MKRMKRGDLPVTLGRGGGGEEKHGICFLWQSIGGRDGYVCMWTRGASVRAVHTSGGSKRRRVRLLLAEKAGKGPEGEEVDSVRVLNTEGVTVGGVQVGGGQVLQLGTKQRRRPCSGLWRRWSGGMWGGV